MYTVLTGQDRSLLLLHIWILARTTALTFSLNPQFALHIFHVYTTISTIVNYDTMYVWVCEAKAHQYLTKAHASGECALILGIVFTVDSQNSNHFLSSLVENMFCVTFYNSLNWQEAGNIWTVKYLTIPKLPIWKQLMRPKKYSSFVDLQLTTSWVWCFKGLCKFGNNWKNSRVPQAIRSSGQ